MQKKQLMTRKPAYRHGQLLLEDDFIDEQRFHWHARCRHARWLHGFGAVQGLEVTRAGDTSIAVSPGYAVDREGREIELREPETLEVHDLPAGAQAWVTIGYRAERPEQAGDKPRIDCYAFLCIATGVEPSDVRLAGVQLDEHGRLGPGAVRVGERDALRTVIGPGSVTAEALDAQLRRDWIAMAFHPTRIPRDERDSQPPFRVGATQAQAHREFEDKPNTRGAAGTMALVLPPGIRRLHRFRVAGSENERRLRATLVKGVFDPKAMKHRRVEVLALQIGPGSYCETADVPEEHHSLADPYSTLAVDLRAEGFVKVSLVAVEVSY